MNEISQYLIITGTIAIIIVAIWILRRQHINMRSHHKIQAIALMGLTLVAVVALIASLSFKDNGLVAVASAAVGGIAGFISHKATLPNRTILFPLEDKEARVNKPLEFTVAGISTAGFNLNYSKSSPDLPDTANLNSISGKFVWTPSKGDVGKSYNVTFTVSDGRGGTDSRTIIIKVKE